MASEYPFPTVDPNLSAAEQADFLARQVDNQANEADPLKRGVVFGLASRSAAQTDDLVDALGARGLAAEIITVSHPQHGSLDMIIAGDDEAVEATLEALEELRRPDRLS